MSESWDKYRKLYSECEKALSKQKKKLLDELIKAHDAYKTETLKEYRAEHERREATLKRDREELEKKFSDLEKKTEAFKRSEAQQKIGEGIEAFLSVFAKAQMDAYFNTRRGFF